MPDQLSRKSEMVPNPGSYAAVKIGCRCPVYDNWRGDPELGRIRGFIVMENCPVHSPKAGAAS